MQLSMPGSRIGEILRTMVELSHHDIDEILAEQRASRRKFGDIAISMGLCRPEHVWRAFSGQKSETATRVDLDTFGVDVQALMHIPSDLARRLSIIPVRAFGDGIVVAVCEERLEEASDVLNQLMSEHVVFVLCDRDQIERAITTYYASAIEAN